MAPSPDAGATSPVVSFREDSRPTSRARSPQTPFPPKRKSGFIRSRTIDSLAAREMFRLRALKSAEDFMCVTGEPDDVLRDPEVACGDTALTFENVSFSVGEKVILEPVSGHFEPGSLVAIMGPSGSGKTTLLDILAGKKSKPHGGTVHFNGRPRDHLFRRISAYVAQDDILPSHLTVQEAVMFHQALKQERPSKYTTEMFEARTEKALEDLGLLLVKDEYIGDKSERGVSGGQRRRVSLACGFAHMPQIMFCDEPTSGLSATDAEACVKYMRLISHRYGITILVVIHQPRAEVAKLFDSLLLLTSGPGRCVYNGPMSRVREYCADIGQPVPPQVNPADFVMDRITPGTSKSCEDQFLEHYDTRCRPVVDALVETHFRDESRKSPMQLLECQHRKLKDFGHMPALRKTKYGVRFRRQLALVGRRQLTLYFRDQRGIASDLATAVLKGLILGLTYMGIGEKDARGQLPFFFMLMMAISIDGMKGMPKQIAERRVMKMETSEALYSIWAYIIPFTVISWVQAVMANTIFMVLLFAICGMPWALFPHLWFWTTMLYLTMDSLFVMLAAVAKDSSTAFVMALPFFMLFLLYNGFTVTRDNAPWYSAWVVEISPVAYSIEQAMMSALKYYKSVNDPAAGLYQVITNFFGYRDEPEIAFAVMLSVMSLFRVMQVMALNFLNNIQR